MAAAVFSGLRDNTVMVLNSAMSIYSEALDGYLKSPGALNQSDLADRSGCTQAAISRYATGKRFPDSTVASKIDETTGGKVPISLWRVVAAERAGLAA